MQDHGLRPWEVTQLTLPQARLYFASKERPQAPRSPSDSLRGEAWRLRTRIFDLMCQRRKAGASELVSLPADELLSLYAFCASGIAKQTTVPIDQLRERLAEYVNDKQQGII